MSDDDGVLWSVEVEGGVNLQLPNADMAGVHRCWIPVGEVRIPARTRRESVVQQAAEKLNLVPAEGSLGVRVVDPRNASEGDVEGERVVRAKATLRGEPVA